MSILCIVDSSSRVFSKVVVRGETDIAPSDDLRVGSISSGVMQLVEKG
tara:strand:- start:226 stop:369 length:144 start_codon:yes stop_codon:yes gene_type:complete